VSSQLPPFVFDQEGIRDGAGASGSADTEEEEPNMSGEVRGFNIATQPCFFRPGGQRGWGLCLWLVMTMVLWSRT
jgi:hypothetical protein